MRSCKSYLWDHLREHHACRVALIFPVFFSWRLRESSFILFPENLNVSSAPGLEVVIGNLVSRVLSLSPSIVYILPSLRGHGNIFDMIDSCSKELMDLSTW